ncbi:MAG: alanine racemase, partial [Aeromicrobium sp.]
MPFALHVNSERWHRHLRTFARATPGLVPVIKGNGYGFGRDLLARESEALVLGMIAVGTYGEVAGALESFSGDVMVLTPWRPFFADVSYD